MVAKKRKALLTNPHYRGKHIVAVNDKVYTAKSGREATKLFKKITREHPHAKPTITYIPKAGTLILALRNGACQTD